LELLPRIQSFVEEIELQNEFSGAGFPTISELKKLPILMKNPAKLR
jgi:hypothetical protein